MQTSRFVDLTQRLAAIDYQRDPATYTDEERESLRSVACELFGMAEGNETGYIDSPVTTAQIVCRLLDENGEGAAHIMRRALAAFEAGDLGHFSDHMGPRLKGDRPEPGDVDLRERAGS